MPVNKYVEDLKRYFEETPKEQLDKDWKELEKWNDVGPTVDEYLKSLNEYITGIKKRQESGEKLTDCELEILQGWSETE